MGGAYASSNDMTELFRDLFLSDCSKLISSATARHWLRSLFTNQDFATEVGMPWEIFLQVLQSGRNVKIFSKAGDINAFHTVAGINPSLAYSVLNPDISTNVGCGISWGNESSRFRIGSSYC